MEEIIISEKKLKIQGVSFSTPICLGLNLKNPFFASRLLLGENLLFGGQNDYIKIIVESIVKTGGKSCFITATINKNECLFETSDVNAFFYKGIFEEKQ